MSGPPQTHHGITVADLDDMEARLRSIGFTAYQPNAEDAAGPCGEAVELFDVSVTAPKEDAHV